VNGGGFRSFAYDTYAGALRIIVRAVQLLDYSPTGDAQYIQTDAVSQATSTVVAGTNTNIGGGDFIRGESGDDVVHGQTGTDRIWGDGQDDDLYGESGYDWISGGAGDDGILGDDGVLLTSRNGVAEPLYGLAATTQAVLSLSRDNQTTTIYSNLALRKEADLEPFYIGHNDVLYGGLGDDWLHAGAGDDAVSGAEALALYYNGDPLATLAALSAYYAVGNVLQHGFRPAQPEEFR
jgi:Ca2+-binding RTX toxin-like protein